VTALAERLPGSDERSLEESIDGALARRPSDSAERTRRAGRIYGIWSPGRGVWNAADPACARALTAMARALGPQARALSPGRIVADADACWLDGAPVRDFTLARERLSTLIGAFALAWTTSDGALHLASDPVGHRSLYHAPIADGGVVFASSLDGVLASGLVRRSLDAHAVPIYLTFAYVPGPRTLIENVRVLPAGHTLVLSAAGQALECYAPLPVEPAESASGAGETSDDERRRALRRELEGAVARALPGSSSEPLGATLSGGIDSSLVLALARRQHRGPLHAYSVSFGAGHANELEWSSLVARHVGVQQHVIEITPERIERELDATVAALSEPNGDPLTVPNSLLFRCAAADTRVVLNGEGGDPCFGGPKNAPMLLAELLGDGAAAPDRYARARRYLRAHQKCYDDLPELLAPALQRELAAGALEELVAGWLDDARRPSLLDRLLALNIAFKGAHHILPKVESLSLVAGVCPRSPLFDFGLVWHSFSIPARLKRAGAVEKYLLKESVRDLLPAAILDRPKSGMLVPVEAWFKGPLLPFARTRLLDGLDRFGLCERRWLEALLDGRAPGLRPRRGVKIWLLLTLESWLRQKLDGRDRGPA